MGWVALHTLHDPKQQARYDVTVTYCCFCLPLNRSGTHFSINITFHVSGMVSVCSASIILVLLVCAPFSRYRWVWLARGLLVTSLADALYFFYPPWWRHIVKRVLQCRAGGH